MDTTNAIQSSSSSFKQLLGSNLFIWSDFCGGVEPANFVMQAKTRVNGRFTFEL